jgi:Uma2 family endonuclease
MIQLGLFTNDDPVELLQGLLIAKFRKTPQHVFVKNWLVEYLSRHLPIRYFVMPNGAITMRDSEPEPDLCVVQGNIRDYVSYHPYPSDVALVIEVADTSLQLDRTVKRAVYANAGIPTY